MAERQSYNSLIGQGDYLDILLVEEYIEKFLRDIETTPFKLTKEYLHKLGYKEGDYSPEMLYENILKSIQERNSQANNTSLQSGGNKTLIKSIKRINKKNIKKTNKRKNTKRTNKKNTKKITITKRKGNLIKKQSKKTINKTKKGGGIGNNAPGAQVMENSTVVVKATPDQLTEAQEIQNTYRIIWIIYSLYILLSYKKSFTNLYNIGEYKRVLNIKDNILSQEVLLYIPDLLLSLLEQYFIEPKNNLLTYLRDNKEEINKNANIYLLNCHGSLGETYFEVPEKTIIVVNTSLNKSSICINEMILYKIILDLEKSIINGDISMYEIYLKLYNKFVKLINPNAMIYLPGQLVNKMYLEIDRKDITPLHSVRDNNESQKEFKSFEDNKGINHTLESILKGENAFNLFNNETQKGFKVIYVYSCNVTYKRNITIDYIYNYFMRLTSHYSNKYDTSNLIPHTEQIYNKSDLNMSDVQTNNIVRQKKNIYDSIVKLLIAGRKLKIVKTEYENMKEIIYNEGTEINFKYILLLIIFYYKNENIKKYNTNSFNFIINELYEKYKIEYINEKEYNDKILEKHLKILFELYLESLTAENVEIFIFYIIILYEENLTVEIVSNLIRKNPEVLLIKDRSNTPLRVYLFNSKDNIKLKIVNTLIDSNSEVLLMQDEDKDIPLHYYLSNYKDNINPEIVTALIGGNKEVLLTQSHENVTPLHYYLSNYKDNINPKIVTALIGGNKEVLLTQNHENLTPLHSYLYYSRYNINPEIVTALIGGNKEVLLTQNHENITPLHYYLYNAEDNIELDLEIVTTLIGSNTEILLMQNHENLTPLHSYLYYSRDNINPEIVSALISDKSEVLIMQDQLNQQTPLYYYLVYSIDNIELEIVSALIDSNSEVLLMQDQLNQETPLHIYLSKDNINPEIVSALISDKPEVLLMLDIDKKIPLHIYLQYKDNIIPDIVKLLIDKDKKVLTIQNTDYNKIPLDMYLEKFKDNIDESIQTLLTPVA
jgi:hypothetical protein